MSRKANYIDTCGEPIELGDNIKRIIKDIAPIGYVNVDNVDGNTYVEVNVGDLHSYNNQYEPPTLEYGDILFDSMFAFMDGDTNKCNELISEFFDKDDMVTYKDSHEQGYLKGSEHNLEYCLFSDKDNVIDKIVEEQGKITMLNPSKGSIVRMMRNGYKDKIQEVIIDNTEDSAYIKSIDNVLYEYDMESSKCDPDKIPNDRNYYVGCYGYLGQKYGLSKYFGFDPNYYSAMINGLVDGIIHNETMTSIRYTRTGHKRMSVQNYKEDRLFRYGCDYLQDRYCDTKAYNAKFGMCHDLVSTYKIFDGGTPIRLSKFMPANSYVLIGDYTNDEKHIYDSKGNIVYEVDCVNHNCRTLSNHWKLLNTKGDMLRDAKYMIGMFSSRCSFLGEKYKIQECDITESQCEISGKYFKIDKNGERAIVRDDKGKIKVKIDNKYLFFSECPLFPHNNQLWQYFNVIDYCYGTYHNIVQDVVRVKERITLDDISRIFMTNEDD